MNHTGRRLNRKLLGWLLAVVAFLVSSSHFLHGYQVRRHADLWRRQAGAARDRGDLASCLEYLGRYLAFEPGDTDALLDYGLALEKLSPSPRTHWQALSTLEQVHTRRPTDPAVRRHLVRLMMSLGRFAEARGHLEELLAASPEIAELEHLTGQCLEATGDYAAAAAWYEKATQHAPGQLASYARLADVLQHRLQEGPRAAEVLDRMVVANEQSFEAHLLRARFGREHLSPGRVAPDIDRARRLAPDNPDVLLAVAALASYQDKPEEAQSYLRNGLEAHPRHAGLYLALAELEVQSQRPGEAIACLRRGLTALPEHTDLLHALADLLLRQDQRSQASEVIGRLARAGSPLARASYWEARLRMHDRQWTEAARLLEDARTRLAVTPAWLQPVELALGQCYEQLGDRDRQLAAYRRAVDLDPASATARYGLGAGLLEAGRVSQAVGELWQVVRLPAAPPDAWTALARAMVLRNRQLTPERRDWQEVERILELAARRTSDPVPVILVRAEALVTRDQPEQARKLLEQARADRPGRLALWNALARLAESRADLPAARRVLEEARQHLGDGIDWRLEWLRFLELSGGMRTPRALAELEQDLGKFPPTDQDRLLWELTEAHYRHGNLAEAERLAKSLAARQPRDLRSRVLLIDLALRSGTEAELERLLAEVRRIEGEEGAQWRLGEAARLVLRARQGDRQGLPRARGYLGEAARRRPDWARIPLAEAAVDELEGNQERAIQDYQRAQELGDRQPAVARRLAQLLYERRRYGEADRALRGLGEVSTLAAEVALANGQADRAVDIARRVVTPESRDYRVRLWLAHILEAAGRPTEAERMLWGTVQQSSTIPETWVALVRFLAATRQVARAEEAIQDLRRQLPAEEVPLTLALCDEAVGRSERVAAHYQAALAARPDDSSALEKAAGFYLRTAIPDKAEPLLRRLIESPLATEEQSAWARRQLAFLLAAQGPDAAYHEALALVEQNLTDQGGAVADRRAKARVLAARPDQRREALNLLENTLTAQPLTPEDQRLLADLYEAAGDRAKARDQWLGLLGVVGQNPEYLTSYIQTLLRWEEIGEARRWFARLENTEPGSPRSLAVKQALEKAHVSQGLSGP